jgi:glycosyltransferase involved in cell wall biosynthesis
LLDLFPDSPDVIHCHNLHGGYFDLRVLSWLSRQAPLVLTLHDAWLLSGHCAHSLGCERWKIGCGQCPDLTLYPAISRDATAGNWRRKRKIFSNSRVHVSTPSHWLMQKVEQSHLRGSIANARVIPNGVDLSIFRPADKRRARAALGLPQETDILLFAANQARTNIWKDYTTLQAAVSKLAESLPEPLLFLCLGGGTGSDHMGSAELRCIPYEKDPQVVAQYYQAADLYVHASRADTFPCSVLEALACATPVIATDVGGIPEQIKGLRGINLNSVDSNRYEADQATGGLVPVGDVEALAATLAQFLRYPTLRREMSTNALRDAQQRFDLNHQAESYLSWYLQLTKNAAATESKTRQTDGCARAFSGQADLPDHRSGRRGRHR